jgi:hypothetical protein
MIAFLILSLGAGPTFEVVNKCPSFVVTNKCPAPAPAAKPVKFTNGFNCGASFCGANGGGGCPQCPNVNGTCACGAKAAPVAAAPVQYTLPQATSSCPNGNCPQAQSYTPLFRFRR